MFPFNSDIYVNMKLNTKKIALYRAILGLLFFPCCLSHYVLEIRAVRYQNPTDEDYNGGSCDTILFPNCDVYFYFCIRNIHLSPSNTHNCWDSITTSSSFEDTDRLFPTTGQLYQGANTQNPLTFTSHNAWPGSFQLLVSSIDDDINSDDLIDRNAFNLNITPTDSWSSLITTSGHYNKVTFTIQVQLSCITGWTGNDCEQCIPRAGCSSINGRCTLPGECICDNGYTGSNCTQPIAATTTSSSITSSTTKYIPSNTNIATPTPFSSAAATIFPSSSTLTPSTNPQSDESNVVTIAGGAAACGVVILLIIVLVIIVSYCVIKSKNKEKMKEAQRNEMPEPFNKNLMYMSPEVLDDKYTK
uniref:EGF-like domain-containing protein n=1 Tax=Amphimedon queenslandica TaxID=400682 RepID=A0A1X7TV61_AMPQE